MNAPTKVSTNLQFYVDGSVKHERMSRKQFNSYLYDLYECKGENDVRPDAQFEWQDGYVEIFNASPSGRLVAIHHSYAGFNFQCVDLLWPIETTTTSYAA